MTWRAEKHLERWEEMVTSNKSWSGGPIPTVSAVKAARQLQRAGCPSLLEEEGEEENEKIIERREGNTNSFALVVKN